MLPEIHFELPWPPSVNKMYVNAPISTGKIGRGRYLTNDARSYKKNASNLIFFSFPRVKYGTEKIEVKIVQFPPDGRKRDRDNGLKIVFDSIERSGIIENDNQIVAFEVLEGPKREIPIWKIWIRPYQINKEFGIFKEFLNTLTKEHSS